MTDFSQLYFLVKQLLLDMQWKVFGGKANSWNNIFHKVIYFLRHCVLHSTYYKCYAKRYMSMRDHEYVNSMNK